MIQLDLEPHKRDKVWYHKGISKDTRILTFNCTCGYTEKGYASPYIIYQLIECPRCKKSGVARLPIEDRNPPLADDEMPERGM